MAFTQCIVLAITSHMWLHVTQTYYAEMAANALLATNKHGCGRFIALGTVYERFAPQIKASNSFGSSDFYVLSKDYAHSMTNQLAYKLGIDYAWCTICHPIGRFIKPEQMMAYAVSSLLAGTKPSFGPALSPYDIVAVEDVAYGLCLLGRAPKLDKREYYIGSGSPKPLFSWLEETRRVLGANVQIGIGERPDDGLCFAESWFDTANLAEATGYAPRVGFADAVKLVAGWVSGLAPRSLA